MSLIDHIEQGRDHSFHWQFQMLWYLYVYICTGIFLYFLISWLFQMGSHWPHWTVKRSLCALAVSNGGGRSSPISFSSNDCFEWVLIDGMDTHRVRSFSLAVLCGGRTSPVTFSSNDCLESVLIDGMETHSCHFFIKQFQMGGGEGMGKDIGQSRFVCQIWAHFKFCSYSTELFHFYK